MGGLSPHERTLTRKAAPDPVVVRRRWRAVIEDARRAAARVQDTGGEEIIDSEEFGHRLALLRGEVFPADGQSASAASAAFLTSVRALRTAAMPLRRRSLAPLVLGGCETLEALLDEEAVQAAAQYARRLGEGDE